MTKSEKDVETIRGDGLWLRMDSNNKLLEIMGDGCKITLLKNFGNIRIIGDGCRLKVIQNLGYIEYKGDGGRVVLGPDSDKGKVTFSGHGGHVNILDEKHQKLSGIMRQENKEAIFSNLKEKRNSDFENDNRENERRERRRKKETKSENGSTIMVTKIVCANGECKTSVRTFHKEVDLTRS